MSCCAGVAVIPGAKCKPHRRPDLEVPAEISERIVCCFACSSVLPPENDLPWTCGETGRPIMIQVTVAGCDLGRYPGPLGRCQRAGRETLGVPWAERVRVKAKGLLVNATALPGCGCRIDWRRRVAGLIWLTSGRDRLGFRVGMGLAKTTAQAVTWAAVLVVRLGYSAKRKVGGGTKAR